MNKSESGKVFEECLRAVFGFSNGFKEGHVTAVWWRNENYARTNSRYKKNTAFLYTNAIFKTCVNGIAAPIFKFVNWKSPPKKRYSTECHLIRWSAFITVTEFMLKICAWSALCASNQVVHIFAGQQIFLFKAYCASVASGICSQYAILNCSWLSINVFVRCELSFGPSIIDCKQWNL